MIVLDEDKFINCGTLRASYQHPENPALLIKVPVGTRKEREQANLKEMKGYHALMREHTDLFCISHCYGFVSTNRGRGLVCDCIRDDAGTVSKTIWDVIVTQDDCDVDYIMAVAREFCHMLLSRRIYIFDINLKNIVVKLHHDGTYEPFVIDLKGRFDNKELFQLSSHIEYFSRKKLERRCRQLLERIPVHRTRRKEMYQSTQEKNNQLLGAQKQATPGK